MTYYQQDVPNADEWKFKTSPENEEYIQETIRTARRIYPPFELYIQAGESLGYMENRDTNEVESLGYTSYDRSLYPSYLRDASPYEIYKIYKGPHIDRAKNLIKDLSTTEDKNSSIIKFFSEKGYNQSYAGIIIFSKKDDPASIDDYREINAKKFKASLTPDQEILMEAWRKKALKSPFYFPNSNAVLNLDSIVSQYKKRRSLEHGPVILNMGFRKYDIANAINKFERTVPGKKLTRDYIRYEGEQAINTNNNKNINQTKLNKNYNLPKAYYMMIYNELINRNLIK